MSTFLDLPPEIRQEIYTHVASGQQLKFAENARETSTDSKKPAPCVALLLCCKQTYAEYRPVFSANARFDVRNCIQGHEDFLKAISCSIDLDVVEHLEFGPDSLSGTDLLSLLRNTPKLKSLTFGRLWGYWVEEDVIEDARDKAVLDMGDDFDIVAECDCSDCAFEWAMRMPDEIKAFCCALKKQLNAESYHLVGKCGCSNAYFGECHPYDAMRKVIAVWQYLQQPFKLITEISIDCDYPGLDKVYGRFDLGSKTMEIISEGTSYVIDEFKVDLKDY